MPFVPLLLVAFFFLACGEQSTAPPTGAESATEDLYSCGMHPHVLQHGPGPCPICGMDLTPVGGGAAAATSAPPGERKIKYWVAPMDPSFISDRPGKSPMGMDLVPVYEDAQSGGSASAQLSIDPTVVQNMGVRTERARRRTVFRHVRSIGQVEVAEDQISVVNLRFSGWVERILVDKTGDQVEKGQVLLEIYSPDLVAAQEEYLLALRTQGAKSALARSARRKLELWELGEQDLDAIARAQRAQRSVPIRAPHSGFVLSKHVVEGARVSAGEDLYHIGDLSSIWVKAEIYEFDAPWVEVGQPAQMELSFEEGHVLEGKVAYIYPTLSEASRTLSVRLEFENPHMRLRPGMFATVYIQYRRKDDVLAIPTEAILDSGTRKLVFVQVADGRFEPREIVTGLTGDRNVTEVHSGLTEGDEIVVSGQFLLDSESQLQEAIRKMLGGRGAASTDEPAARDTVFSCPMHPEVLSSEPGRCPECGMDLAERRASPEELARLHAGHAHEHPAAAAEPAPARWACPMHPEVESDEPGRCSVCGIFLEKTEADEGERP